MKIRWPSLWFGPINLWNAPHQPALEDTMAAVENDAVQDQLCARIDELQAEKEALAAQLDRAEEEMALLLADEFDATANDCIDAARALYRAGYRREES